jgi:outer membrane protein assembly factor BamD (BamD/ComL family)
MCDTPSVRRISSKWVITAVLALATTACKPKETVEPEKEWTPDETLEPEQRTADPAPGMTEEEKTEKAKELYKEAEGKAKAEDWAGALALYEEAYHLVPGKHGFALKVGIAAEKSGDCAKAMQYYEHFVTYAEPEKYEDDIKATKKSLDALKKKGC